MPEYLAPGVYVEETSFRPNTIEGVSTSTAGFIGPARFGPIEGEPPLLTSFASFERVYGGLDPLEFGGARATNYLAHGVRAFFEEGGRRCYVARVAEAEAAASSSANADSPPDTGVNIVARHPGAAGDMKLTFAPRVGENVLATDPLTNTPVLRGVQPNDTVVVTSGSPPASVLHDAVIVDEELQLRDGDGTNHELSEFAGADVRVLTTDVSIERPIIRPQRPSERFDAAEVLQGFSFHPDNTGSVARYFAQDAPTRRIALEVPFFVEDAPSPPTLATGVEWAEAIFANLDFSDLNAVGDATVYRLDGGSDGASWPLAGDYEGDERAVTNDSGDQVLVKTGFRSFEDLEDISIVAGPGYSQRANDAQLEATQAQLISHCERMRYRIAVLDSRNGDIVQEIRQQRGQIDSTHAAIYYPWVRVVDPITGQELDLPPSGFVSGIYARNDVDHGVQKAPANEVVRLAIGFETLINKAQQDVLNPEGINCFRFFEGRGYRLWGARTVTSNPEWKYVNLRRYFAFLERSIDRGTQWVVFESNGERLWENVRRTVEGFLYNEWRSGRLMGLTPEEAYFVRCDRTTMTQNDIDNGRLICLIGVAPLRPAEFVIFRIGQKLLDSNG